MKSLAKAAVALTAKAAVALAAGEGGAGPAEEIAVAKVMKRPSGVTGIDMSDVFAKLNIDFHAKAPMKYNTFVCRAYDRGRDRAEAAKWETTKAKAFGSEQSAEASVLFHKLKAG